MTGKAAKIKLPVLGAALAAALLLTAYVLGPNLALRLGLGLLLPLKTGLTISCDQADWRDGRLFLENLTLTGEDPGQLTIGQLTVGRVEIFGLKPLDLLWPRPGSKLAELVEFGNIRWEIGGWLLTAPSLQVKWPRWPASETDLPFYQLDLAGLRGEGLGLPAAPEFQVRNLSLDSSVSHLTGLDFQAVTEAGLWTGEVKALKLDGFKTALDRLSQNEGRPWSLIPELLHLHIDSGHLALEGRPVIEVRAANPEARFLFTQFSTEAVSHNYSLELTFTPSNLAPVDIFWPNLAGLTGEPLDLDLTLDLTLDPQERAFQLRSLGLDVRNLGRLDLAAELSGLGHEGGSLAEILVALYPASLHSLSLAFQDQGLIGRYYAWLAEAGGWDEAESPARIKAELLVPLVEALEAEGALANLPALAAAVETFLDQPEYIMLSAGPAQPLLLARLVKMDRYDIIEKLEITLTVNDQPPVAVSVTH